MMQMPETIGDRIRKVRIESGMSQRKFARSVYVTRSTVYRWEKGKSVPYAHDVQHIAELCGVSCDYLILGKCINIGANT